jgi:hypothetical protein
VTSTICIYSIYYVCMEEVGTNNFPCIVGILQGTFTFGAQGVVAMLDRITNFLTCHDRMPICMCT